MDRAGAGWSSTGVLCLLFACTLCAHQGAALAWDDLDISPVFGSRPESHQPLTALVQCDPALHAVSYQTDVPIGCLSSQWVDDHSIASTCRPPSPPSGCRTVCSTIWSDHQNFYSWDVALDLTLALSATAILANTSLDEDFRHWYQDDVRNADTSRIGDGAKIYGNGWYVMPAFLGLAVVGSFFDEGTCGGVLGEFCARTTRGYLVGGPPVAVLQLALGGSRPTEGEDGSRWAPFDDANSVSGHAFVGAVPFITAAKMADRPWLKAGLYACSTLTAWSRLDHDIHYLSQVCLGWWMAYLAAGAVDQTETGCQRFTLIPVTTPEMIGIGAVCER